MSRPSILLVDDDPAVRSSIKFALEIEGFDVTTYESAEALLRDTSTNEYNCIVLDHRLPGIDGLQLLSQLRRHGENAPAIIITSNPSSRLRLKVEDTGARLIEKPLLRDELTAALYAACGKEQK